MLCWHAGRVPARGCQCCSVPHRAAARACAQARAHPGLSWGAHQRQNDMPVKALACFLQPHCFPLAGGWICVLGNGWVIPGKGMK